jgi:aminoglycoside phosphotransferase (APT) family kinase protein
MSQSGNEPGSSNHPDASVELLAAAIHEEGWPAALPSVVAALSAEYAESVRWSLARRHTSWQGLLPSERRERVTVIDFGLGTPILALARSFTRVDAVYTDSARRDIAQARARLAQARNVEFHFVRDLASAPIDSHACDAVCVCELPAECFTVELVAAMRKWIAPGGGMFVSMLRPRASDAWTYVRAHVRIRALFPMRRYFRYMGHPTRASEIAPMRMFAGSLRQRVASMLAPVYSSALAVVGTDGAASPPTFDAILDHVSERLGLRAIEVLRYCFSHPAGFTLEVRDRNGIGLFIRMPLDESADVRIGRNFAHLHELAQVRMGVGTTFPLPIDSGIVVGQRYYVESAVTGRPLTRDNVADPERQVACLHAALDWIGTFHERTAILRTFGSDDWDRLIGEPTRVAGEHLLAKDASTILDRLLWFLRTRLSGRALPFVFAHGDYTFDNLVFDESLGRVRGVFDWDLGDQMGLPLVDALYCILTARRAANGASTVNATATILAELLQGKFTENESAYLDEYRSRIELTPDDILTFTILMWVHHLGVRMRDGERFCIAREDWRPVLEALDQLLPGVESDEAGQCRFYSFV